MSVERVHVYPGVTAKRLVPVLEARLPHLDVVTVEDEAALAALIDEIEVLVAWSVPPGALAAAPKLRLVQAPGAGVDTLLTASGLGDEVVLCNGSGAHEPHMAEFVIALLLALVKQIPRLVDQQREHRWRIVASPTLAGRRACVIGLGSVGLSVARRLTALGVSVDGIRQSGQPVEGIERVFRPEERLEALKGADIAIVITPRTPETLGLVGGAELSMLNPHGYLIDVSRGGITDAQAVIDALAGGRLAGAALDVFEEEPLPADSPLWDVPGLLLTPHTVGHSPDYNANLAEIFAANLAALDGDGEFRTLVDRERGY